jgi:hypothetical protein
LLIDNRPGSGDRRTAERRKRDVPARSERRHGQERRRREERQQQDLQALYMQSSDDTCWLCSQLGKLPADNPISRLLVVQRFLLDHRPRQDNAWIMRWARHLRETYDRGDLVGMCSSVSHALHGGRAHQT